MATNANPFIVNLVDLQNIATSITGQSATSQLQLDVANLQQMVHFETKTIVADILTNFTPGQQVQIQNLSQSNTVVNTTTVPTNTSINIQPSSISFTVAGDTIMQLEPTGMVQFISSPTYFSTGVSINGWLYVSESAFVKNLYQTSDKTLKTNITPFFTTVNDVLRLEPQTFTWKTTGDSDVGFIAQDVHAVWPSLTTTNPQDGTMGIAYSRFIPLLLESIRELNARVSLLESSSFRPKT